VVCALVAVRSKLPVPSAFREESMTPDQEPSVPARKNFTPLVARVSAAEFGIQGSSRAIGSLKPSKPKREAWR
jgi:hypothetical protein